VLNASSEFSGKISNVEQLVISGAYNIKRGLGLFMFLSVVIFFGIKKQISLKIILPLILLVSLTDIFTANKNVYRNMGINEFLKPGSTIEFLQKDKSLFRIFDSPAILRQNMFVPERDYFEGVSGLKERAVSDRGMSFGIYDAYGYGSLYNRRQEEIIDIIVRSGVPGETNLLNLLNVKYVISPKDFKTDGYDIVRKSEKVNIYENKNFLPRAFLADGAVIIRDKKKILERLKSKDFKPEKEVILEEDWRLEDRGQRVASIGRREAVDILRYESGKVIIEAETDAPRFLVLSDTWYPGWKVYVDDKPDKIYRTDYILRSVHLEPGKHIVKFTYDPFSFKIGIIITLGTIGILLGLWIKKLL
jgi:uncharacterized membrane protein YfhO